MTIRELKEQQVTAEKEITALQLALKKKILKYFKGVKPIITQSPTGIVIAVCSDYACVTILTVNTIGYSHESCITEDLATKIKDDVIAVYGELDI